VHRKAVALGGDMKGLGGRRHVEEVVMTGLLRDMQARYCNDGELQEQRERRNETAVNKRPAMVVADELGK